MTSDEAKQALKEGKMVRKKSWDKHDYIREEPCYIDSRGVHVEYIFEYQEQDDEWEIVE